MTQEAVLVFEMSPPIPMTCANGTGIEKGAILKITDPFTVALASGDGDPVAGIAAEEKIASDGKTSISVYRRGIFKLEAGTSGVTVGYPIIIEANNEFKDTAANGSDTGYVWGVALETATDNETFLMELK